MCDGKRARVTVRACVCVCMRGEVYFPASCGCYTSSVKWKIAFWHLLHSNTQENKFPHKTTLFTTHAHTHTHSSSSSILLKKAQTLGTREVAEKWKSRLSCWSCLLLWNFPGNLPFQSFSLRDERVAKEAGGDGVLSIAGQSSTLWSSAHSGASSHVSSASKPKPLWNSGAAGTWNHMRKRRLVSQYLWAARYTKCLNVEISRD